MLCIMFSIHGPPPHFMVEGAGLGPMLALEQKNEKTLIILQLMKVQYHYCIEHYISVTDIYI